MNLAHQITAVTRRVARSGTERAVTVEQSFATTPEDLWEACTTPTRLARWFEPVEGDLTPGGRYRLPQSGTEGTVEQCDRPHTLRISWEHDGEASTVEVRLTPEGRGTRLSLRHTASAGDHWTTYGPAAGGVGWDESLLALSLLLAGDDRADPGRRAELVGTRAGQEFVHDVARSWCDADIAAGADPDHARARAEHSAAFWVNSG